jgi:PHD-finger
MAASSKTPVSVNAQPEKNVCGDCNKVVHDREKGLLCEVCNEWYHTKCQNVSAETYSFLQKEDGIHWYCKGCDKGVSKLLQSMSVLQKRQDIFESELTNIKGDITDIQTSIQALDTKMECMIDTKVCDTIEEKVEEKVDLKVKFMSAKVEEDMEIERRKYNVIFHGVVEDVNMSDADIIKHVVSNGLKLDHTRHIEEITRIGKTVNGKVRPIRVVLRAWESKKELLQRAKDLKDDDRFKKIYITPDLTRKQQEADKNLRDNLKKIRAEGEPTAKIQAGRVIKNLEGQQAVVLYDPPK